MHARPILRALAPSWRPLDFTIGGEDTYHQHQNSESQAARGLYNSFFPWSPAEWTDDSPPDSGIEKSNCNGMGRLEVMARYGTQQEVCTYIMFRISPGICT
ncbi:hypothetical protein BS47DRAFT_1353178 [Hydnum rufescens UP504]|uniref:Uncharacterized protein n=1 Tax=Hydnum rufescens UP504 TaxID=1448309 RepID=A0A9P6AIW4_9AGAM|nr:hypothetical protein BS47DRAFT_1353178 [Hydnum rufescens UP504]